MNKEEIIKAKVFDLFTALLRTVVTEAQEQDDYNIDYLVRILSFTAAWRVTSCINEFNSFYKSLEKDDPELEDHLSENAKKYYQKYYTEMSNKPLEYLEEVIFAEKIIGKHIDYNESKRTKKKKI